MLILGKVCSADLVPSAIYVFRISLHPKPADPEWDNRVIRNSWIRCPSSRGCLFEKGKLSVTEHSPSHRAYCLDYDNAPRAHSFLQVFSSLRLEMNENPLHPLSQLRV